MFADGPRERWCVDKVDGTGDKILSFSVVEIFTHIFKVDISCFLGYISLDN